MRCYVVFALISVLLLQSNDVQSYKILGLFTTSFKSHFITGSALMKGLAAAGHEVTVLSPFPQSKPIKNYRDIHVEGIIEVMEVAMPNTLDLHKLNFVTIPLALTAMGFFISNFTMHHETVQQFLKSKDERFDLVIMEVFMNEAMHGFAHHFGAPMIGFSTFGASTWTTDLVGTPSPMSYVPNAFLSFSDKMSFWQRLGNIAFSTYEALHFQSFIRLQSEMYESVFPRTDKPPLADLRKNVSLVLLNNHFTMNFPRPYAPNMIEVGGIHINRKAARPLPKGLLEFVEGAQHGCVYFSMGSILKSTHMTVQVRDDILKAFSKFKQRVLWKWEDENLPGKPDNVFIAKWFPQDDVLAHENVKLFITHGGLLSSTEAVYFGVPIIGIPVFADQKLNMARAVNAGYGLTIDYVGLTEELLSAALNEMLGNAKYAQKVKLVSSLYRDQPMTPLETAIYWVEYVARHKGAPHMRSASQDLCWVSLYNLDVFAFVLLVVLLVLYAFKRLLWAVLGKKSPPISKKKKQ